MPLDHFSTTKCGEIVQQDYVSAVLADDRRQAEYGTAIRVTDGLGCPRKRVIGLKENLSINPLDYNSPLTGTAWHEKLQAHSDQPEHCEVEVGGTIAGVDVVGHIDRVRFFDGSVTLQDAKHTNDYSFKYIKADGPKPEHVCQLSIYAELYYQTFDVKPVSGTIWYHATVGGFLPQWVAFWPIEQCLIFKPYGGQYCYLDLLLQVSGGLAGDWRNLPLAGESQTFGSKSACDYCSVRDVCWTAARGAPF